MRIVITGASSGIGAALARIEGQVAFELMLRRLPHWAFEPGPLVWRSNLGLRGLTRLPLRFGEVGSATTPAPGGR